MVDMGEAGSEIGDAIEGRDTQAAPKMEGPQSWKVNVCHRLREAEPGRVRCVDLVRVGPYRHVFFSSVSSSPLHRGPRGRAMPICTAARATARGAAVQGHAAAIRASDVTALPR